MKDCVFIFKAKQKKENKTTTSILVAIKACKWDVRKVRKFNSMFFRVRVREPNRFLPVNLIENYVFIQISKCQ